MTDEYYAEPTLVDVLQRNALDPRPSQLSWEFQKPLLMDWLRRSATLAPMALPGRAPLSMLRRQDLALRPLTAAELEKAAVYRRILNQEPLGTTPKPSERAPGSADPPSFYEMWKGQGKK